MVFLIYKVQTVEPPRAIFAHVLVCVTDQLNAKIGGNQFPEMQARTVFKKHIPAQVAFGGCTFFGANVL